MRTTIPILLITLVFFFHSVESSSHESSSSGGSGSHPSFSVDGTELHPGEIDVVHGGKILTKANFPNKRVIPFKTSTQLFQYKPVENQEPHHDKQYEAVGVAPKEWLKDIRSFAKENNNDWIIESAKVEYLQHINTLREASVREATNKMVEEYERRREEFERRREAKQ